MAFLFLNVLGVPKIELVKDCNINDGDIMLKSGTLVIAYGQRSSFSGTLPDGGGTSAYASILLFSYTHVGICAQFCVCMDKTQMNLAACYMRSRYYNETSWTWVKSH